MASLSLGTRGTKFAQAVRHVPSCHSSLTLTYLYDRIYTLDVSTEEPLRTIPPVRVTVDEPTSSLISRP